MFEKDRTKLEFNKYSKWRKTERAKTVLTAKTGFMAGNAAAGILSRRQQTEFKVTISSERTNQIRIQSRKILTNFGVQRNPEDCMSKTFTIKELEDDLKKIKENESL